MERIASINDLQIKESERKYHWPLGDVQKIIPLCLTWASKIA